MLPGIVQNQNLHHRGQRSALPFRSGAQHLLDIRRGADGDGFELSLWHGEVSLQKLNANVLRFALVC